MSTLDTVAKPKPASLDDKIFRICNDLAGLDPGPLADLRRMDATSEHYGAPYFWRLRARYDLAAGGPLEQSWAQIIQALAMLTPKGRDDTKPKPSRHARWETSVDDVGAVATDDQPKHRRPRGLGHVLCDGGDLSWTPEDPKNPKPAYSETRFAQLLGSTGETRIDLVLRLARFLADRLPAEATFDCTDLALLLLKPDDPNVGRKIARDFYARLDGARRIETNETTTSPGDDA